MIYTGIGSRETPEKFLKMFAELGYYLAGKGLILRSGGAPGADSAFEYGCDYANGKKEIYLPWQGFENKQGIVLNDPRASVVAKRYHPKYDSLSQGAKKLIDRDVYQVLGQDFITISDFVICYTKRGMGSGGTGQALRIAKAYNIPILDVGGYECLDLVDELCTDGIKEFLEQFNF